MYTRTIERIVKYTSVETILDFSSRQLMVTELLNTRCIRYSDYFWTFRLVNLGNPLIIPWQYADKQTVEITGKSGQCPLN